MKVTPVGKNFNKHKIGEHFVLPDKLALALIKLGKLSAVDELQDVEISPRTGRPKRTYQRRDMQAQA